MQMNDWQNQVENYAAKSEAHNDRVVAAKNQASNLRDTEDYWEAVYTLVRQREQMEGTTG